MWGRRVVILATMIGLVMTGTVQVEATKGREVRFPCSMQKKVNDRWVGTLSLTDANRLRAKAVRLGENVARVRRNEVTQADVSYLLDCVARAYKMDPQPFKDVAMCESHMDPEAVNPAGPYHSIFQYLPSTWLSSSATYDHKGADIHDGYAQIHVTVQKVKAEGWGAWGICI